MMRGAKHGFMLERIRASWQRDPYPWVLAVVALLLYAPGAGWGFPAFNDADRLHAWGNDDLVPLAPLADLHNSFIRAKPDWNTAYPWFQYFLLACAYAPYLGFLYLTGQMSRPTESYPFGLHDPVTAFTVLTVIGRSVSLVMAVLVVLGAYLAAKTLFGRSDGLLAGLITMLAYPMTYYARVGSVDIAAMAWMSLSLAAWAWELKKGLSTRSAVVLGVLVGLTVCTKDQMGAALYLPMAFLMIYSLARGPENSLGRWRSRWVGPLVCAASFAITFLLAGGFLVTPERARRHFGLFATMAERAGMAHPRLPATPAGYLAQMQDVGLLLVDVLTWPLLLAAVAGAVLLFRRNRLALALALSPLGYLLLLVPFRFAFIHYLLPLAIPLSGLAAYAITAGWRAGKVARLAVAAVLAAGLGALLLYSLDLTHDMLRDSRCSASAWFAQHTRPGDRVLAFGGRLFQPRYPAAVETQHVEYRKDALPAIIATRPEFIIINPDNTTETRERVEWRRGRYSIHSDYIPEEVYDQLAGGRLGYRLVAQFQSSRLLPWLDRPFLSYPVVNIPIHIYAREDRAAGFPPLTPWSTAPHYPKSFRAREVTRERLREFAR